ncbi:MAG: carbohydrate ABC transporter permease [Lachnospiraceae bacterium]|nr:carbohydrate ABC transporter permease [Lachnospiraceae bacterium]
MEFTRKKKKNSAFDIAVTVISLVLVAAVLYPLILVVSSSISDPVAAASGEVLLLPKGFTLEGYKRVFQDEHIMMGYANSLFYTIVGTLINLLVTIPAGYVMTKTEVPGTKFIMKLFLFTMYFSGGMVPAFLLMNSLGLYNTRWVLLILGAFSVYNCIICRSFFLGLPKELEEAAYIDGSSYIKTFMTIILPLSKALLGVMVLYFAVAHWNSYFNAMIYTYDANIQPLQLFLRRILILEKTSAEMMEAGGDEYAAQQQQVAALIKYAVIVVSSLPLMIIYPFLQKFFEKGVMIGSVKG